MHTQKKILMNFKQIIIILNFFSINSRLPVVNECPAGQTARVTSNLHSSSSSNMAVSRVPSPPLPEVNTPVAENWCYTQVSKMNLQTNNICHKLYFFHCLKDTFFLLQLKNTKCTFFTSPIRIKY